MGVQVSGWKRHCNRQRATRDKANWITSCKGPRGSTAHSVAAAWWISWRWHRWHGLELETGFVNSVL